MKDYVIVLVAGSQCKSLIAIHSTRCSGAESYASAVHHSGVAIIGWAQSLYLFGQERRSKNDTIRIESHTRRKCIQPKEFDGTIIVPNKCGPWSWKTQHPCILAFMSSEAHRICLGLITHTSCSLLGFVLGGHISPVVQSSTYAHNPKAHPHPADCANISKSDR